ncbi:KH domain-containing, RNA-binding, signal transduction-associated protein 1 [Oryzias melastigma]|uniref:KH domain-containing, RNA-binding, signal transduction-associated protein 1 n=1 Tax=Oryzias melastigma TaxID=30732 RepID=A0A834CNI3_ORYME|nr:KH domain-containing, RNA-binding, signal transduction-associated protein 1 [Oryzias melastigma]
MEDTKYLPELLAEKDSLDSSFTHAMKLLAAEIDRIQKGESKKEPEKETYLDLFATKSLKLKERVLIPIKQYPRVNFVGKLLGPQGSTIKRLQEETGAKISVLGKGSMRDKNKEEELRKGGEAKYAHLAMELHVFIEVTAPIPEAYMRMAHAMDEVKKFLIPMSPAGGAVLAGAGVVHPAQEDQGVGECHVAVLEGPCVAEHHVEDSGAALHLEEHQRAGGDFLLLPLEEAILHAQDHPHAGAARMLPSAAMSHQQHQGGPSGSQAKPDGYDEYPSYEEGYAEPAYEGYDSYYSQQSASADTEYYDYGHGEAQDTGYDSYGKSIKLPF